MPARRRFEVSVMKWLIPTIFMLNLAFPLPSAKAKIESEAGPLAVEVVEDLTIKDTARKKNLSCKVYFPAAGGPYPVILFSHGFGGNKDAFAPVSRHWASQGYVVVHPTHADGLNRALGGLQREQAPRLPLNRPGWLVASLNDPHIVRDRVADLILILDSLESLPQTSPALAGKMDIKSIGVAGHSFGAYTTMLIGGVTADLGQEKAKSFRDPRVKSMLLISAQGTGQQGLTPESWKDLQLPMMNITGTRDRGARGQGLEWKKEPFLYSPPGHKYLVVIDGANHFSFGGRFGGGDDAIVTTVKKCTMHFWDAYLKGSAAARNYLQSEKLVRDCGNISIYDRK
jgi:predicted dienelactone hydrolase